jgi:hypothetical protein
MSTSDGHVLGLAKIVDHGPASLRFNMVIVGDGYTSDQMGKYAQDVDLILDDIRHERPFDELWCGINVYRIDVVSLESGGDDPASCDDGSPGSGATPRTYFDAGYCSGGIRRALTVNNATVKSVIQAYVPEAHYRLCIVNSSIRGGTGGEISVVNSTGGGAVAIHEMGHTVFGLADEYEYLRGCNVGETDHSNHPPVEPAAPNVTINFDPATIKWAGLLTNPADVFPTETNPDCQACLPSPVGLVPSYIGAYEGADTYRCGAYRPAKTCIMRAAGYGSGFCAVCKQVIRDTLAPFQPPESLTLVTPSIAFTDIPEGVGGTGVTTWRAIVFEVVTCGTRVFRITAGPTGGFGTPLATAILVDASHNDPVAQARIWLSYTSTTAGATAAGSVTIRCDQTGESWDIPIVANTVARQNAMVALVLDHSGSMSEDAGGGTNKVGKLRQACNIFVSAMFDGDVLGIVRFDDTAEIILPFSYLGPPLIGAGRVAAGGVLGGPQLDPDGMTGIGGGILAAKPLLDETEASNAYALENGDPPPFGSVAMLVITDGMENQAPMIADVASSISASCFAIGMGTAQNISVAALNALTLGNAGYLLVTGKLDSSQVLRLSKYMLQILAGISNADVVLDPGGLAPPGAELRIPFQLTEADMDVDVFLLAPQQSVTRFALETPAGAIIDRQGEPLPSNAQNVTGSDMTYYRLSLPGLTSDPKGSHSGKWHALITLGRAAQDARGAPRDGSSKESAIPYDVVVHSRSNLKLRASAEQASFEPGATVTLHATLCEYDVPVQDRARMWAEVTRPDGTRVDLPMPEVEPGRFEAQMTASTTGLYHLRMRAAGVTFAGTSFRREQTATAAVFQGGDRPSETVKDSSNDAICRLISCLQHSGAIDNRAIKRLKEEGVDIDAISDCLKKLCSKKRDPSGERPSERHR